jgi:SAM-dependent methyltransferase
MMVNKNKIKKIIEKLIIFRTYSYPLKHIHKLIKFVKNKKGSNPRILDIGSLEGNYIGDLKEVGKVTTLDIDNSYKPDIVGDVHKLTIKNRSYDIITLFQVLEHLHSPHKALKECYRVLAKKGYLLISAPQYWHTHGYPSDYYRYTKYGLEYLCKHAGFKVVKIWSMGGPFLVLFHLIALNLALGNWKNPFKLLLHNLLGFILNALDFLLFKHEDKRKFNDSVGWCVVAQKIK